MTETKNLPVPAWFKPREILTAFISGKKTEEIAASLCVPKEQLMYVLRTRAPEDWQEAQVIRAIRRKEEAEDELETADDPLKLRKAEVKLKSAQWDLERICRRIYGDDVPKDRGREGVIITLNLGAPPEPKVVIEHEKQ